MGHRRFQGAESAGRIEPRCRERSSTTEFAIRATIAVALSAVGIITLWLLQRGVGVLLMLFAGVLMAVLLRTSAEPLVRYAKFPLWAAVLTVVVAGIGALVGTGMLIAPSVSEQFQELSVRLPEAIDRLRAKFFSYEWSRWLIERGNVVAPRGAEIMTRAGQAFGVTAAAVAAIVIVLFLAIFMAMSPRTYVGGFIRLMPVGFRPRAKQVASELYRMLRVWLLTKLFTMVLTGVGIGVGLWLMDIPLALALAIVAGILEFIPTIGPLLSAIPAVVLAFVNSPMAAVKVAVLYFAVQWIGNHVTTPLIQQRTLSIPPAVTLALVALLGTFFGFGGLLLSGPLAVVTIVLVKMLYVEDVLERRRGKRQRGGHRPESPAHEPPSGGAPDVSAS